MAVVNGSFDHPLTIEEKAIAPMAGGIMQHGYQCGMLWGTVLAAGAQAHQLYGPGPRAEVMAIMAAQRIIASFRTLNRYTDCLEITDLDLTSPTMKMVTHFLLKGGAIGCFRMAARTAPAAFDEINIAFSNGHVSSPSAPVSCAALLARKMGASEMHQVMAAGLAGGIGLSGGACGALGAAIWMVGLHKLEAGAEKLEYPDARAQEVIETFIKSSGYEFECSAIARRRFVDAADHASYLHQGGCAQLIDVLAAA